MSGHAENDKESSSHITANPASRFIRPSISVSGHADKDNECSSNPTSRSTVRTSTESGLSGQNTELTLSGDLASVSQKKPVVHSIVGPSGTTSKQVDCRSFGNYVEPSESRTLFYLFSGPILSHTSLQPFLAKHGWACKHFDRRLNLDTDGVKPLDLLGVTVWQQVLAELESAPGDFYIMSPPCSTMSPARQHRPGPLPLRTVKEPYGIKNRVPPMSVKERTEVREANVLYIKTLLLARALHSKHIGFLVEYHEADCVSGLCVGFGFRHFQEIRGIEVFTSEALASLERCQRQATIRVCCSLAYFSKKE